MTTGFNKLEKRIVQLSYKHQLSHISSCLNCVNLIDWIYEERWRNTALRSGNIEPFVLGNSHAALALYVVLEQHSYCDAEEMVKTHGTHASRDMDHGIWVSGGSLGQAETVAVGMALADKDRTVWLVTSDGACMEGAVYEAMRVSLQHCPNLRTFVVYNGLGAYGKIDQGDLPLQAEVHYVNQLRYPEWLRGLAGHYLKLSKEQYEELMQ